MRTTSRGTTQQSSAPYNRRVVLDFIRQHGAASRKDIVDRVSLSPQTVANITNDLEAIGLIVSRRLKVDKTRGQPPIAFELNPDAGTAIGISLEPGRASAALVNLVGDIRARSELVVDTRDRRQILAGMLELVSQLRKNSRERLWGIGVALPGPLGANELSFVGPTALEGWVDLSVLDELRDITGLPLFHSVDSVAGALGETLFGEAKSLNNFFYLHFGPGSWRRASREPYGLPRCERQRDRDRACAAGARWPSLLLRQPRLPGALCVHALAGRGHGRG